MDLTDIIYKRRSSRDFTDEKISSDIMESITNFADNLKPLVPGIKTSYEIVDNSQVTLLLNWRAQYYVAIFSEEKDYYLENSGFMYQQLDLYLQSIGLGSCWIGLGKAKSSVQKDSQKLIILIGFGKVRTTPYRELSEFNRLSLNDISDITDEKLKPAQYAPSASNSQPWYFTHDNDIYLMYRQKNNFIRRKFMNKFNKIDIGIALAHMYLTNKDTFEFIDCEENKKIDGYEYECSFKI
ncbi:nitroreductase family protein [Methanosphaera sp.]|jgi:nitroreductase|uniref:nitroreductase family protein n=1 Tax=Methanosphaera sp. TaxID=2666342 RepID=UPI003D8D3795